MQHHQLSVSRLRVGVSNGSRAMGPAQCGASLTGSSGNLNPRRLVLLL